MCCNEVEHRNNMQTISNLSPLLSGSALAGNQPSSSLVASKEDEFSVQFKLADQNLRASESHAKVGSLHNTTVEASGTESPVEMPVVYEDMEDSDRNHGGSYESEIDLPINVHPNAEGALYDLTLAENSDLAVGVPQAQPVQMDSDQSDLAQFQKRAESGESIRLDGNSETDSSVPALRNSANLAREVDGQSRPQVGQLAISEEDWEAEAIRKTPTKNGIPVSSETRTEYNDSQQKVREPAQNLLRIPHAGIAPGQPVAGATLEIEEFQTETNGLDYAKSSGRAVNTTKADFDWWVGNNPTGVANAAASKAGIDQLTKATDQEFLAEIVTTSLPNSTLQTGPFSVEEGVSGRPEMARIVAVQMADAMIKAQSNKVEIALNPEELGRVRMVLTSAETGVSVSITAERPETLDMMRRHIELLTEEFRKLGYEDIGFEFAGGDAPGIFGKDGTESQSESNSEMNNYRESPEPGPVTMVRTTQSRGLDLRL